MNVKKQFLKGNLAVKPENNTEASDLVYFCIFNGKTEYTPYNRKEIDVSFPLYGFSVRHGLDIKNLDRFSLGENFKHGYITYQQFKEQLKDKKWKPKTGEVVLVSNYKGKEFWQERTFFKYDKNKNVYVCYGALDAYYGWEYIKQIK